MGTGWRELALAGVAVGCLAGGLTGRAHSMAVAHRLCTSGPIWWQALFAATEQTKVQEQEIRFEVTDRVLAPIDDRLFGQFMERPSWGEIGPEGALVPSTGDLQPKVLEMLEAMRIPIVRFPGGTDVDYLDWRDMIDNVPGRDGGRPVSTGHTGQQVTNRFGYDEFLRLGERLHWDVILVVNLGDALLGRRPVKEAALHAAGLVAYCNAPVGASLPEGMIDWPAVRSKNGHTTPCGVEYVQLGNETWAFRKKMDEMHPGRREDVTVECIVEYEKAVHAVDPTVKLIMDYDEGVTPRIRERLGDRVSYLSAHFYTPWMIQTAVKDGVEVQPGSLTAEDIWYAWVSAPKIDDDGLAMLEAKTFEAAPRLGYKVASTEWNWNGGWGHFVQDVALDSALARGLGAAGFLHALMRRAGVVEIATQSMLVGKGWGIAAILADPEAVLEPRFRPSGLVTMMYSQHHGNRLMEMKAHGVPTYVQPFQMQGIKPSPKVAMIDAVATASDSAVYWHAINRSFDRELSVTIELTDLGPTAATARMYILEGDLEDDGRLGSQSPPVWIREVPVAVNESMVTVQLPPRSVVVVEVGRQ